MAFRLYSAARTYLLIPDWPLASLAAARRFGPLRDLGSVKSSGFTLTEFVSLWMQIDDASYAVINEDVVSRVSRVSPTLELDITPFHLA